MPINTGADKLIWPTSKIVFLGLQIDSVEMVVSIPLQKINTIIEKVRTALQSNKMSLKQLQSLIGSLSFVCKAISPGRAFLRRLIDLTKGTTRAWHQIRITVGAKQDLQIWLRFLRDFNGSSMIPDQMWHAGEDLQFFTDASGDIGFGGYFGGGGSRINGQRKHWGIHHLERIVSNRDSGGIMGCFVKREKNYPRV